MREQKHTSANTSINSTKLPAVYNKFKFQPGMRVLDYGCGKYVDHIKKKMDELDCNWYGYDKFNQPEVINMETKHMMKNGRFDIGICSNVLNVIDSPDVIKYIVKELKDCCETAVFFIYEGNKSGIGKISKNDCWQRNESVDLYVELISDMGYNPIRKGNMIVC